MAAPYERIASCFEEDLPMHPGGFALTDRAMELCKLPPEALVLDVGCGTGGTVQRLMSRYGFRAFGADPSFLLLQKGCTGSVPRTVVRALGEDLPFYASVWDCVLAECSLSVAKDPAEMLRECRRLLKEGGRLVLSDLYLRNPAGIADRRRLVSGCCLRGALPREDLLDRLETIGFHVLVWEDHSTALKQYAARLLLSCGSVEEFRELFCVGGAEADGKEFRRTMTSAKPGYFLLVAEKRGE